MYEVYLERSAERDLKRLSAEDYYRIIPHIKALNNNPRPLGCRKITGSESDWRIRVGDYRIIYEIVEKAKQVKVMKIRHRREVYR
ncbi:MAG: type II toxin-antitoxin system RelE/ParE family toxin [Deltaproteobacteria bacterium]|nr:type II toxin-antitoxin system RelE/ParE family toxin [Deltaproteobacteria bacterium]